MYIYIILQREATKIVEQIHWKVEDRPDMALRILGPVDW